MKVTIIGAGNMGRGIGARLVEGGNDLQIFDRDPAEARALADELAGKGNGSATAAAEGDRIEGDVVVPAVYYGSMPSLLERYGEQLAGKVVVDITNPMDVETFDGLVTPPDSSAAEELAKRLAAGTPVVKAFNTTFAGTLAEGQAAGEQLDVFVAGDDEDAKRKVSELIEAGGMRAIDAGPLRRARQLEHLGFLHILLQEPLGAGFGSTLKLHW
jgi:8-hydroxy-5-deazaflavin:NADPH oxidoreductase